MNGPRLRKPSFRILGAIGVLVLSEAVFGCGDSAARLMPLASTPAPTSTPGSDLTITAITPSTGSTRGETTIRITGTGFRSGLTVRFGGDAVSARFDSRYLDGSTAFVITPSHYSATVDVIVTNPDGQTARLPAAYTYASPVSFDFNGRWSGFGNAGQDIAIEFRIEDGLVTGVSCDTDSLAFSPGIPVSEGEFLLLRPETGVVFSGRIVGVAAATGSIHFARCTDTQWNAIRLPSPPQ